MTPKESWTPIKKALAVLMNHPELLTLDQQTKTAREHEIAALPSFQPVWAFISKHPMPPANATPRADGAPAETNDDSAWATQVPVAGAAGVVQWRLSANMRKTIRAPLAAALCHAREAASSVAHGPARTRKASTRKARTRKAGTSGAKGDFALEDLPARFGLAIESIAYAAADHAYRLTLTNAYPRHLSVYVEYTDAAGKPVAPDGWVSRLPPGASSLETATRKYLAILPPHVAVAGMDLPAGPAAVSLPLAAPGVGARLWFGGLGMGAIDPVIDAGAVLLTALLDYAVPVILDGADANLTHANWFAGLITRDDIIAEILAAAHIMVSEPLVDAAAVLGAVETGIGTWLLGGALPTLRGAISDALSSTAITNAAPVLGWAAATLAAQTADPATAQTSSQVLSSPATFALDLVPLTIAVQPDPRRGRWPDAAATCVVAVAYNGSTIATATVPVPPSGHGPVTVSIPALPAGGTVAVTADAYSANGWRCGHASAPSWPLPVACTEVIAERLTLDEGPVPLTASTQYIRLRSLAYRSAAGTAATRTGATGTGATKSGTPGTYAWQRAAPKTASGSLTAVVGITLHEAAGVIGYAWRAAVGGPFAFQTVGVAEAEPAVASSGGIFSTRPHLLFDRCGDAQRARSGLGANFYLDPRTESVDGHDHLRQIPLDGSSTFDTSATASWGAFDASPTALAVHPAGFAVACDRDGDTVQALTLPATGTALATAPRVMYTVGRGTGAGQVQGPVGLAVTDDGVVLVLEQGNARVQAFDAYGNPVPRFASSSPFVPLDSDARIRYLDVAAGPGGTFFVLSTVGNKANDHRLDLHAADGQKLSRTPGILGERMVADSWGRVYTIATTPIEGRGGQREPSVHQWTPSVPTAAATPSHSIPTGALP